MRVADRCLIYCFLDPKPKLYLSKMVYTILYGRRIVLSTVTLHQSDSDH